MLAGIGFAFAALGTIAFIAYYFSPGSGSKTGGKPTDPPVYATGKPAVKTIRPIDADLTDLQGGGNMEDAIDALEEYRDNAGEEAALPESPWMDTSEYQPGRDNIAHVNIVRPEPIDVITGTPEVDEDPGSNSPYIE